MKRIISGLAIGLSFSIGSWATTPLCTDQSSTGVGGNKLSNYIALGSGGCMMNGILFYDFQYSYSLGTDSYYISGPAGTGLLRSAELVSVTVDGLNTASQYGGPWTVNHYQTASLSVSFSIYAPNSVISTIRSTINPVSSGTQNGGPTGTVAATCTGGTCAPTTFTNTEVSIAGTNGPLTITNTAVMNANGSSTNSTNSYFVGTITNQFAPTGPPGQIYAMVTSSPVGHFCRVATALTTAPRIRTTEYSVKGTRHAGSMALARSNGKV